MTKPPISTEPIAVIGLGCRYPDARNPRELWENILTKRQAFRRMPDCRLPLSEYGDPTGADPDKTYVERAAVIDGFEFDWVGHRIPKQTFESTDIAHWLALDVALQTVSDAGYSRETLPSERTGVIVGNTLTGEQFRSTNMLVRWPFVSKSLRAAAASVGMSREEIDTLTAAAEQYYKSPFPPFDEDTLAGNLSNTIAGRICNFLDLQGGGYTVDGACSSSLLSIANAANALSLGDIDVALAGGVDVSLDPFELVGFARVGALSKGDMRVYDRAADGFLPGEGCGFVMLKRFSDAHRDGDYIYAVLRGWGVSSDGAGGITAPDRGGQALSIRRAYDRAGYSPHTIDFVEGHGTGTPIGDPVELGAIASTLGAFGEPKPRQCGVTSFKSLVGHTKAAAGIGGFIKSTIAVNRRILPPTAGCTDPNPIFDADARSLYPIVHGEIRSPSDRLRAGVSAMGFGGINTHATIESADPPATRLSPALDERALLSSHQDTELFLLAAPTIEALARRAEEVALLAEGMSPAELTDLGAQLAREVRPGQPWRGAVIAGSPAELHAFVSEALQALRGNTISEGQVHRAANDRLWVGHVSEKPRVGFVFPGQGSQQINMAASLVNRFAWARELAARADGWLAEVGAAPVGTLMFKNLDRAEDKTTIKSWNQALTQTEVAQPAICLASLIWLQYLARLGIHPQVVGGHSLGELTAFHAAGAFDEKTLLQFAALRGRAMASVLEEGTMASLGCDLETAERLLADVDGYAVVANVNSASQVAISGEPGAIEQAIGKAKEDGIGAVPLAVSGAFHSKHFEPATEALRHSELLPDALGPIRASLLSAIDGETVPAKQNLREYFANQMLARVDFLSLTQSLGHYADLLIEVGPGQVLTRLMRSTLGKEGALALPIESKPGRDRDLNIAVATLYAHGVRVQAETLYENRLVREFTPASERKFIENPCERPFAETVAPVYAEKQVGGATLLPPASSEALTFSHSLPPPPAAVAQHAVSSAPPAPHRRVQASMVVQKSDARTVFIDALAKKTGFPPDTLTDDLRLLDDLHLDSIKAAELISEAAIAVGASEFDPGEYSNATVSEIIAALDARKTEAPSEPVSALPEAITSKPPTWTRNFVMKWVEQPLKTVPSDTSAFNRHTLIIAQPEDSAAAIKLQQGFRRRRVEAQVCAIEELSLELASDFESFVVLLPRSSARMPDDESLRAWTGWLSILARALPTTPPSPSEPPAIVFVRWEDDPLRKEGYLAPAFDGFVASLHLERRQLRFRSVVLEDEHADLLGIVDAELQRDSAFEQVCYDADGKRWAIEPQLHENRKVARAKSLQAGDLVLVTGGARGITAECALALAEATGVRMVLVGSSPPPEMAPDRRSSPQIDSTLTRFRKKDLWCEYRRCDVGDRAQVKALVDSLQQEFGSIAGVIHGAGLNRPRRAHEVSADEAFSEVSPKLLGALHLFEALDADSPKMFIALTSIIGAVGMPNNAWYAFSNQSLDRSLGRFRERHPETEVLSVAYSIWDEIGMGVDLGSIEHLAKIGTEAIPVEEGTRRFVDLVTHDPGVREVIVSSKLGGVDTWRPSAPPPPVANRFLDQIKSFVPGVELTVRTRLSVERDPYLLDHNYKGSLLFPTVFGLEAMGQAVAHVTGRTAFDEPIVIEDIDLSRPLSVNPDRGLPIEIKARVLESKDGRERIHVGIGCDRTGFGVDHFSALFVLGAPPSEERLEFDMPGEPLPLDPQKHLYGNILFQGPRFQRLQRVYQLSSKRCVFAAERRFTDEWILGDPYFRDALLQSVQLCVVPDECLPVRIARAELRSPFKKGDEVNLGVAIVERTDREHYETLVRAESRGKPTEMYWGYSTRILGRRADWPGVDELISLRTGESALRRTEEESEDDPFRLVSRS